jgi:plasmid stabilization system protein ParE
MGEFQVRLTSQAARDLREIVAYIARDNPAAAERFGFALVEKAELLKKFPLLGKKVKGTEKDRVLVEDPILIFYQLDGASNDDYVGPVAAPGATVTSSRCFNASQRPSTLFNTLQHDSTLEGLARKNHAEKRSDELMAG